MSDNYKETLNLPKTDFPMKANLPQREPDILAHWESIGLYQKLMAQNADKPTFILHDGPPYANGDIHLGHAVNKTLKDIIVKSKLLSGHNAPYVPGWDCHGLPIELKVEKKIGKAGVKVDVRAFRDACRDYARSQVETQRAAFIRLGGLGDWQNPYLTMDYQYEANIIRTLGSIIAGGHLAHGRKPVHWCVDCGSALAEAEVEYQDKTSSAIYVRFRAIDPQAVAKAFGVDQDLRGANLSFPIWTTTPWTLPANQAIAVNASHQYSLIQLADEWLVLASELKDELLNRLGNPAYTVVAEVPGAALERLVCQHPFIDRHSLVILGDHVTLDAGTGNVHTAPAHGQDDYVVCSRYDLTADNPANNPVDDRGCFRDSVAFFAGMHVFKANASIIEKCREVGALLFDETLQHSYPHCWRHKTPLIFRATPQWFISMDKNGLRQNALTAIKASKWIPEWGENRIAEMVGNRPDWCISRQRVWGTPMPLVVHKETYELHPNWAEILEQVAVRVEQEGLAVWDEMALEDLVSDADAYQKVTDSLDVWFDSGVSHACVLEQNPALHAPADLYLEGSDQHRGWFQTSLLTSVALHNQAPFRQVLTHGFITDQNGHKMSKSLGNVIEPGDVISQVGADPLRLWAAESDYRGELTFSNEILKRSTDAYRRIRNTARFLLSNLSDFDFATDALSASNMLELDRWAVDCTARLQDEIKALYEGYQFHHLVKKIHRFCTVEMGGFYLDILKDRLYTAKHDGVPRRSAQTAMYHILEAFVRWLAPILSFTAEEIWQHMPGARAESVFMVEWYDALSTVDETLREKWQRIMATREVVYKELEDLRKQNIIGSGLAADVAIYCNGELLEPLRSIENELRFVFITSSAEVNALEDRSQFDAEFLDEHGFALRVEASKHEKCSRCWHRLPDVGADHEHPTLCSRCVTNVAGQGEERQYA